MSSSGSGPAPCEPDRDAASAGMPPPREARPPCGRPPRPAPADRPPGRPGRPAGSAGDLRSPRRCRPRAPAPARAATRPASRAVARAPGRAGPGRRPRAAGRAGSRSAPRAEHSRPDPSASAAAPRGVGQQRQGRDLGPVQVASGDCGELGELPGGGPETVDRLPVPRRRSPAAGSTSCAADRAVSMASSGLPAASRTMRSRSAAGTSAADLTSSSSAAADSGPSSNSAPSVPRARSAPRTASSSGRGGSRRLVSTSRTGSRVIRRPA